MDYVYICMCVSVCMRGMCTHIHMYIWKVTLREVAMFLCVLVVYMCGMYIYIYTCMEGYILLWTHD